MMLDTISENAIGLQLFTWQETVFRIIIAMIFGALLGWDRARKNKPIDFRVYMIVCVSTCITAMMGQELLNDFSASTDKIISLDLGKLIAGVLTGIGFLGAGAIIKRDDDQVVGTATGASIWASGGLGLTLGFCVYALAFIGFAAVFLTLLLGGMLINATEGKKDKEEKDMSS